MEFRLFSELSLVSAWLLYPSTSIKSLDVSLLFNQVLDHQIIKSNFSKCPTMKARQLYALISASILLILTTMITRSHRLQSLIAQIQLKATVLLNSKVWQALAMIVEISPLIFWLIIIGISVKNLYSPCGAHNYWQKCEK